MGCFLPVDMWYTTLGEELNGRPVLILCTLNRIVQGGWLSGKMSRQVGEAPEGSRVQLQVGSFL